MSFLKRFASFFSSQNIITSSPVVYGGDIIADSKKSRKIEEPVEIISKEFEINSFEKLIIHGFINVEFSQSEKSSLVITGEEKVVSLVEIDNKNNKLEISIETNFIRYAKLTAYISSPDVVFVHHAGAGIFTLQNIDKKNFEIRKDGAGDIKFKGVCKELFAKQYGSGKLNFEKLISESITIKKDGAGSLKISGTTKNLDLKIFGAGTVDTRKTIAENVTIKKEGAGSCQIHASKSVKGSSDGAGSLSVYGQPENRSITKNGAGSLQYHGK